MVTWKSITLLISVLLDIAQVLNAHESSLTDSEKPTDPAWIILGDHEYKIYSRKVTRDEAVDRCKDINSTLAVFDNKDTVKKLAKYLLTGRPSIETPWIDAVHEDTKNKKKWGCLVLNYHGEGDDTVHYNTVRCSGSRSYVCHRRVLDKGLLVAVPGNRAIDITKAGYGYRVFYAPVSWFNAKKKCESYKKYGGKMVELRAKEIYKHLIYIMSESLLEIDHLWLGGFYKNQKWWWVSDKTEINVNAINGWVPPPEPESENTCLNVDVEDFNVLMFYGADCFYPQSFACSFPVDKLKQLQKDEKEQRMKKLGSRYPLLRKVKNGKKSNKS